MDRRLVPRCRRRTAELWLNFHDRERVTLAADHADKQLRRDPQTIGESRAEGRRILIVPPLAVTYRVLIDDRMVRVVNVRQFPAKSS